MNIKTLLTVAAFFLTSGVALAEGGATGAIHPEDQAWSWEGPFGTFDRTQLQRGYQVYKDVCASCHSMKLINFRNLSQPGGPEFSDAQMKALAAAAKVPSLDDKGEATERAATPADPLPSPFANDKAARANNNNALPPDLSVIAKARAHGIEGSGPDYLFALLTGYTAAPADFHVLDGLHYNPYFEGRQISMPPPLGSEGLVTWPEGNPKATPEQMARDVVAYMVWAADPKMEERKQLGVKVIIFLSGLAVLLFFAYRRVWKDVPH